MTHPPTTKALWTRADCFDAKHPHSATTAPLPAARGPHPILFLFILHMAAPSFLYPDTHLDRPCTISLSLYLGLSLSFRRNMYTISTHHTHLIMSLHPLIITRSTAVYDTLRRQPYRQADIQAGRYTGADRYTSTGGRFPRAHRILYIQAARGRYTIR